jgi:hypothetical protein
MPSSSREEPTARKTLTVVTSFDDRWIALALKQLVSTVNI